MDLASESTARWTDVAVRQVVAAARRGLGPDVSPFGEHAGRADLRGFDVRAAFGDRVKKLGVEHVDLSSGRVGMGRTERSTFVDVVFDGVDARMLSDSGNRFVECSFTGTDFREAGLGYDGSRYESCVFEKAKFNRAVFARAEFDSCVFDHCQLDGVDFAGSSFVRCRFAGLLDDVWFRGGFGTKYELKRFGRPRPNRMEHVDFREAALRWPTFSDGCDLSTVRPPADGRHVLVDRFSERLGRLRATAADAPERLHPVAEHFLTVYGSRSKTQDWYVLNIDDLAGEYGPVGADFVLEGLGFDQRA